MRKHLFGSVILAVLGTVANVNTARSQSVIISPVSATANGQTSGALSNIYDHSGLNHGFISGVTEFAPYIASNPTHDKRGASYNLTSNSSTSYIDMSLGSTYLVESFVLWSHERNKRKDSSFSFTLLASDDPTFNKFTDLGTFTTSDFADPKRGASAQVFTLPATEGEYFRFQINTECNYPRSIRIGEVAFGLAGPTVVPEPTTVFGMAAAGFGFVGLVRRRLKRSIPESKLAG